MTFLCFQSTSSCAAVVGMLQTGCCDHQQIFIIIIIIIIIILSLLHHVPGPSSQLLTALELHAEFCQMCIMPVAYTAGARGP